jgi:hypothetical protein
MFEKTKLRITKPVQNVATIAWAALTVAILSLLMALGALGKRRAI